MMRIRKTLILTVLIIYPFLLWSKEIHIKSGGNDHNVGTYENPLKTIKGARDIIRKLSMKERHQNIDVILHDGKYFMDETVVFSIEDSAPDGYIYKYKAAKGATPILTSGVTITGWKKIKSKPKGLPEISKEHIWVADIPHNTGKFYVLYDGNKRLTRARNKGFNMPEVKFKKFASRNVAQNKDRALLKKLPFPQEVIKKWENLNDIEAFFCPVPWCVNYSPIERVDEENQIAWLKYEANSPPFTTPKNYNPAYIENVIDFLDEPGEWVVNTKTKKIYYWPINGTPGNDIIAPSLIEYIKVEGDINYNEAVDIPVRNINFKGLTFKHGNRYQWWDDHKGWGIQHDWDKFDTPNALIRFRGAANCTIEECHFTASGCSAIRLDLHAQNINIKNNLINHVGHMGILLCGYGPGTKDVNKNNIITNNIIDHCGEVIWHGHAIFVWQSGENYIANNLIQNCPRKAIGICGVRGPIFKEGPSVDWDEASKTLRWNEIDSSLQNSHNITQEAILPYLHARNNLVEYNEVYRCRTKIGDGAALNVSGAGTGNIVRSNILIDVVGNGMRTDDWQRGTEFSNNIICSGGIVHKGHNHITNNIFHNTNIRFTTYPEQQPNPGSKVNNNIMFFTRKNISPYTERKTKDIYTPDDCILKNNIYYSTEDPEKISDFINLNQSEKGWEEGSRVVNPMFAKPIPNFRKVKAQDFKLSPNSPAYNTGFSKIEYDKFGLRKDFPLKLQKKIFPIASGEWISKDADISFSSTQNAIPDYAQVLLHSHEEPDIEYAIRSRKEHMPYIILDLKQSKQINSLRVIGSGKDGDDNNKTLTIYLSYDKTNWTEIWKNDPYNTKSGRMWDIFPDSQKHARYVKIGLKEKGILTLKNINIYGK
ncbi:hypothetical protein E9993_12675 [Labilibacter sediminis]|nr:hypothetical protein E9993_12675 [Labilibacter sediminis]